MNIFSGMTSVKCDATKRKEAAALRITIKQLSKLTKLFKFTHYSNNADLEEPETKIVHSNRIIRNQSQVCIPEETCNDPDQHLPSLMIQQIS